MTTSASSHQKNEISILRLLYPRYEYDDVDLIADLSFFSYIFMVEKMGISLKSRKESVCCR
jgi:hypothetical protein